MSLILDGTNGLSDVDGTAAAPALRGTDANTGIFFPAADTIAFAEGGAEAMRINSSGLVGIGTTNPGQLLDISTTTGDIQLRLGNSVTGGQFTYDIGRIAGTGLFQFYGNQSGAVGYIFSGTNGERMRIDSSGNVLVTNAAGLGYGTGAGGTVTQATNKGTAVTLNKPTGQVTTNNAALASGATVSFSINNSIISATDVIVLAVTGGSSYTVQPQFVSGGVANIRLTNTTGGSLSEAVVINFAVIKGATS